MLLLELMLKPADRTPAIFLPSRITPALLASMVMLPWVISGKPLDKLIITAALEGKILGSNVSVSPCSASNNACRSVPGPLSAALVTRIGTGVDVGDG
jgi:hypothetical protein